MQLVAYGAQDVYLTGNPQITFFKVVYRRHTNFAIECIECTFQGTPSMNQKSVCPITRNGDLVTKMYLKTTTTDTDTNGADTNIANYGYNLIDYVELQIGGSRIDRHYGHWLSTWTNLTRPQGLDSTFNAMMGGSEATLENGTQLYIPLQFFCNRNDGLALPLIALQYHDVRVEFNFNSSANATASGDIGIENTVLMVDYIYLDSEERKRFAQASHEYLIEQVQYQQESTTVSASGSTNRFRLNFNHPCKELIWVTRQSSDAPDVNTAVTASDTAILRLNGHDRFSEQKASYFNLVQPYQHHTRGNLTGVHVYSFALNPEEHQPSGTCNFSRIDNAELSVKITDDDTNDNIDQTNVYATNYNVLRIMSGMGGLAYSN